MWTCEVQWTAYLPTQLQHHALRSFIIFGTDISFFLFFETWKLLSFSMSSGIPCAIGLTKVVESHSKELILSVALTFFYASNEIVQNQISLQFIFFNFYKLEKLSLWVEWKGTKGKGKSARKRWGKEKIKRFFHLSYPLLHAGHLFSSKHLNFYTFKFIYNKFKIGAIVRNVWRPELPQMYVANWKTQEVN